MTDELQAALPREMYVDAGHWAAEREAVLYGEWYCVGRRRRPRPGRPEAGRRGRRGGRVGAADQRRGRRPARGVQRLPAPRLPALPAGAAGPDAARAALPLPLVDLRPRRFAAAVAARDRRRPGGVRAAPGRRRDLAGLRLRPPHAGRGASRSPEQVAHAGADAAQLRHRRPGHRAGAALRGRGQLQGAARELQRVLPLRAGPPRAVPAGAVVRRRRRRPRLGPRDPAPRGCLDVHDVRHHDARAAARARRARAHPAQGRPGLPQPDALGLRRPRGGVRPAPARGGPHRGRSARCCSPARPRSPTRPSTPATPPSCGTWSTSRTGRSASRSSAGMSSRAYTHGWFAPMEDDSLDIRRWLLPRLRGGADDRAVRLRRRRARRARQRRRVGAGPPRPRGCWGWSGSGSGHSHGASHDTSRILRHSYHTPAYVRLTQEAYADWAAARARVAGSRWSPRTGGLDLFPPDPAIPPDRLHGSRWTRSASPTRPSTPTRSWSGGPQLRVPPGTLALYQADAAIVPAGRHHGGAARPGPAPRRRAARPLAGARAGGPRRRGLRVTTADAGDHLPRRRRHRRRLGQRRGRPPRAAGAARGHARAGHLLRARAARAASRDLPLWIWMDDPSFYGFPPYGEATVKAAQDCGGPIVVARRPRPATRTRRWRRCSPSTCSGCCPGSAPRCGRCAASTR